MAIHTIKPLYGNISPDRGFDYGTKSSVDKELCPVKHIVFFIASYAYLDKGRRQNVLPVSFGIHFNAQILEVQEQNGGIIIL